MEALCSQVLDFDLVVTHISVISKDNERFEMIVLVRTFGGAGGQLLYV